MSFHEILEAARKRDKAALQSVLATNNSIDIWRKCSDKWSALSECASKGDMASVLFLLDNHANINYAIRGAAFGGYFAEVTAWLSLPGADIGYAIFGAAQGGHFTEVESWLLQPGAYFNDAIFVRHSVDILLKSKHGYHTLVVIFVTRLSVRRKVVISSKLIPGLYQLEPRSILMMCFTV